jgi:hypothetical protein
LVGGDACVLRAEVVAGVAVVLVCFDLAMLVEWDDLLEILLVFGC